MGESINVVVNTHGHCFDGAASAATFTSLLRAIDARDLRFSYRSCGYGPKMQQVPGEWLDGAVNAILDFRYTESDKLSFYFDHHKTGFGSADERSRADQRIAGTSRKLYYEPTYGSCTKLIADVAKREYGVELSGLAELVRWADIIDTAGFESAAAALASTPAQRIAAVIEHAGDTTFLNAFVPLLATRSLEELTHDPLVAEREPAIIEARETALARIKARAQVRGEVVLVDLADEVLTASGKFVTYALYPETAYSVMVVRTKQLIKLAVGYNPWCGRKRRHDIAEIMKREGGGGHPVVGAAAFPLNGAAEARAAAARVVRELET
jgi:hypothetical protein